jgi:hypothetical protein
MFNGTPPSDRSDSLQEPAHQNYMLLLYRFLASALLRVPSYLAMLPDSAAGLELTSLNGFSAAACRLCFQLSATALTSTGWMLETQALQQSLALLVSPKASSTALFLAALQCIHCTQQQQQLAAQMPRVAAST